MELIRTDDFIRRIFVHSDCLPSVVLYSDSQISDIKGMCFDREKRKCHRNYRQDI